MPVFSIPPQKPQPSTSGQHSQDLGDGLFLQSCPEVVVEGELLTSGSPKHFLDFLLGER
jgi:hypothetical protein